MSRCQNCLLATFTWPLRFAKSIISCSLLIPSIVTRNRHLSWKSLIIYFIFVTTATILFIRIRTDNGTTDTSSKSSLDADAVVECRFPKLSLSVNGLRFAVSKTINIKCHSRFTPVTIDNYAVRLIHKHLSCTVFFYLGQGDRRYREVPIVLHYNVNVSLLSDHFIVKCRQSSNDTLPLVNQISYPKLPYASIRYDDKVRRRLAAVTKQKDDLNVLILGLDSVSRLQFERMLPKTFDYITNKLDGIVLKGYNILGDGTPAQIIPMLTGKQEKELPSTLHRDRHGSFVNVYPFIWNNYRERGYVTGYAEDGPHIGIWTLRLRGFKQTPTDHYLLPFYRLPGSRASCIGNRTSLEYFLSYIRQFWASYPTDKKFFFGFFKKYTHDGYSSGSLADAPILNLLRTLRKSGELERTVVVLMTDHGARFSAARRTSQGAIEERLPFLSFILPSSFRQKYPHAINALRTNINRLTTPYDVYATLMSLFDMNKASNITNPKVTQRAISLFNIIPAQRTCNHLKLEPHWCSCLRWQEVSVNNTKITEVAKHVVNYINQLLPTVKPSLCHPLTLDSVHSAQINGAKKSFTASVWGGRLLSHWNTANDIIFYQITFGTKPNGAIYEATTQYKSRTGTFITDHTHISRVNAYKSSADCIVRSYPHLRKFCFCIK